MHQDETFHALPSEKRRLKNGKENNKMDDASMIMQVFGKLLVEDQELFIKFLRELCARQDIEDKKEPASYAHPTGENTY